MDKKRTYVKPEWRTFGMPTAQAGGGGHNQIGPQGYCSTGLSAGDGMCESGGHPYEPGLCFPGSGDQGQNRCVSGVGVR